MLHSNKPQTNKIMPNGVEFKEWQRTQESLRRPMNVPPPGIAPWKLKEQEESRRKAKEITELNRQHHIALEKERSVKTSQGGGKSSNRNSCWEKEPYANLTTVKSWTLLFLKIILFILGTLVLAFFMNS